MSNRFQSKGRSEGQRQQHKQFGSNKSSNTSVTKKKFEPRAKINQIVFEPTPVWHENGILSDFPEISDKSLADLNDDQKTQLLKIAVDLLEKDTESYIAVASTSSSQKQFFSEILNAGTLSDKVSALTLLVQESPLHAMKSLNGLLALAKKKNRTAALQSTEALKDLFANGNVLPDRKLVWFTNQDSRKLTVAKQSLEDPSKLDNKLNKLIKQWLIVWAYEDWLKQFYFSFVQLLETLSHDPIVHVRASILSDIMDLMRAKPEQEVNLLKLGANKLGDPDRRTASKASHLILTLEQAHPAMKRVIVNAVSELIFRPGADYHARYYSTITLNQTIVTVKDKDLANSLIEIYFSLFERLMAESKKLKDTGIVEKKVKKGRWKNKDKPNQAAVPKGGKPKLSPEAQEEANMRLISSILTGLNRAFPYSSLDNAVFKAHLSVLYHVARSGNFNTRVQALMLLFQISSASQVQSDRFYATLYESLLDPRVITSSKQALYLNLVFKALKSDLNVDRVKAFTKRLVQVATETVNVGFAAGVIYLLSEVETASPFIRSLITDSPDNGDDDEEHFQDVDSDGEMKPVEESQKKSASVDYDGKNHDPLKANASASCLWELGPLTRHYHPTVTHFATHFLNHTAAGSRPDLALHSLTHFLDRFVYKSPKTKVQGKSGGAGSIMQPMSNSSAYATKNVLLLSTKASRKSVPSTNSIDWARTVSLAKDANEAPDEKFFAKYFISKGAAPKGVKKEDENHDLDEEELDSDAEEDEIWQAMVRSRGDVEGGEDVDEGDDISDTELADGLEEEDESEVSDAEAVIEGDDSEDDLDIGDDDSELDPEEFAKAFAAANSDEEDDEDEEDEEGEEEDDDAELDKIFEAENLKNKNVQTKGKRKSGEKDSDEKSSEKTKRRRKIKDLPVFASADDYKDLLSDDE
ncbi:CBF/Mak21 family-domain-containing protein [Lipomyces japonicus]|uniref:CBF/Mak21 family-domain-containing protein n=1 Tax=Lipomyces japonicus TaxID=56871 RepID=UPI0034CEA0FF